MPAYHIITIGCQMNISDSERLAGKLEQHGYRKTDDKYSADLVVINTCGVRQSAENRVYGLIPKIKEKNSKVKIILTGCLVGRKDVRRRLEKYVDVWLPINKIFNFSAQVCRASQRLVRLGRRSASGGQFFRPSLSRQPEAGPPWAEIRLRRTIFKQFSNYNFQTKIDKTKCGDYLDIKPNYESKFSAFVPIGNGCDNFCSYCVVPYARGREVYRPAGEILDEVKDLVKQGYREIILIAQNVNSYKSEEPPLNFPLCKGENVSLLTKEGRFNFADLLNMVNQIPGDFWIRFFTSHPKDMSDQLIKVLAKCEKVCHQIHLPAQVGDDGVLKRMNRGYTVSDYVKLIKKIKNILNDQIPMANDQTNFKLQIPNSKQFSNFRLIPPEAKSTSLLRQAVWQLPVSITTDIIVGFPGETKKQFDRTAELMRRVKFDMAYIAKYSPRPGTSAFKLADNVSRKEKVKRAKQLDRILRQTALVNNKKYLGKTVEVLVESKTKAGEWFGKTATGKDIRFSADSEALKAGDFIKVKVTRAKEFCLSGAAAKKYKGVRFGN